MDYVKRAVTIFVPNLDSLVDKIVWRKGKKHVPTFLLVTIPSYIMENHEVDTLCMDRFYVNSNVFFHTIPRNLQLSTVAHVNIRKKPV